MKKIIHVSDLTGKDIEDHVQIIIKREGHSIKIGNNTYVGDTTLDVDASELADLAKNISFEKNVMPRVIMSKPVSSPPQASVLFFGPGDKPSDELSVINKSNDQSPDSALKEFP
jgi:hypothetical protein